MHNDKPASLWEAHDIADLVNSDEGTYLEFIKPSEFLRKGHFSRDVFATEIVESVSAFLNSDGGVILIGVQTNKDSQDRKRETLKPLEQWAPNETFENLEISLTTSQVQDAIYGNLVPKPTKVEVKAIDIPICDIKTTVFVVTVPKSSLGAHQSARTKLYYQRGIDGDHPMYDFEIRDVNNRRTGPLLYLACRTSNQVNIPAEEAWRNSSAESSIINSKELSYYRAKLLFAVSNFGRGTANIARFDIGIPSPWQLYNCSGEITGINIMNYMKLRNDLQYLLGNRVTVFWKPEKCSEIPHPYRNKKCAEQKVAWQQIIYTGTESPNYPIWPNAGRIIIGTLGLQRPCHDGSTIAGLLPWRALSDEMPETRGVILLQEFNNDLRVFNHEMDEISWWGEAEDLQKFEDLKQIFQV